MDTGFPLMCLPAAPAPLLPLVTKQTAGHLTKAVMLLQSFQRRFRGIRYFLRHSTSASRERLRFSSPATILASANKGAGYGRQKTAKKSKILSYPCSKFSISSSMRPPACPLGLIENFAPAETQAFSLFHRRCPHRRRRPPGPLTTSPHRHGDVLVTALNAPPPPGHMGSCQFVRPQVGRR